VASNYIASHPEEIARIDAKIKEALEDIPTVD